MANQLQQVGRSQGTLGSHSPEGGRYAESQLAKGVLKEGVYLPDGDGASLTFVALLRNVST